MASWQRSSSEEASTSPTNSHASKHRLFRELAPWEIFFLYAGKFSQERQSLVHMCGEPGVLRRENVYSCVLQGSAMKGQVKNCLRCLGKHFLVRRYRKVSPRQYYIFIPLSSSGDWAFKQNPNSFSSLGLLH